MYRRQFWSAVAAGVCLALAPGAAAGHAAPASSRSAAVVPPAAPAPTDTGRSPQAPDPHPPLGGLAPDGSPVGGAALRSRGVVVPPGTRALPDSLTAQGWILVDLDTGDVLAARDPHGRYQPASILKALTSVTLLPLLPGDRRVTVSAAAAAAEGSAAGLVAGGSYTVDQLFSGLLLVSGNDTAAALADAAGGYAQTVDLMNATAQRLGAYDTYVQTPSGLDGWQQLTSAYDMAIVLRAAVHEPRFLGYDRQVSAQLPWQQVNGYGPVGLVNQGSTFLRTVPGALVYKTGYTDAAQHTFLGAVARGGRRLGVVFLRARRWPRDQWQQATDLLDWGFALPPGTPPVGHLDPARAPAAPPPAAPAARSVAALAPVGAARADEQLTLPLALGCVGAGGAAVAWWRRRSAGRPGARQRR